MLIFDSHTHLNDPDFSDHTEDYVKHAHKLGINKIANVGSNEVMNEQALQLSKQYDDMYAILGYHPADAKEFTPAAEAKLKEQLKNKKVIAVGEIGLDFYKNNVPKKVQERVFRRQIRLAKKMNLPISVHTREALEDTYRILKEENIREIGGVIHSFNGDSEWMKKFVDLGLMISYSGLASFKNTKQVHEAVRQTPLNKILVETDAPYLAPVPLRGHQNEPANTLYVLEAIARFKDVNPSEIAPIIYNNTQNFFKLNQATSN